MLVGIIDRYVLRQFALTFFICFVSMTGLYVVFDAFSNLDAFLSAAEKQGNLMALMGEYYFYRSLSFFDRVSAVLALVSAMFTLTALQRHNEMTALMAAGIARFRVALPVLGAAMAVSLIAVANRECVLPQFRSQLSQTPDDLLGESARTLRPRYDNKTDVLIRGAATFANEQRIKEPNFWLPAGLDRYGSQLIAENAYYQGPDNQHPGGYLFRRVRQPQELLRQPSLLGPEGEVVIYTPRDAAWLQPDECFLVSEVTFEQLAGGSTWRQFSSTWELIRDLDNPSLGYGADVKVAIHARLLQPLLDLNLFLLGLPLVLGSGNRNPFVAIGQCAAVVAVFTVTVLGAQYLGAAVYLAPHTAAWLPLLVFAPVAAYCSKGLRC